MRPYNIFKFIPLNLHLLRDRQPQMPCILQQAHTLIRNIEKDHCCPQHRSIPDHSHIQNVRHSHQQKDQFCSLPYASPPKSHKKGTKIPRKKHLPSLTNAFNNIYTIFHQIKKLSIQFPPHNTDKSFYQMLLSFLLCLLSHHMFYTLLYYLHLS